MLIVAYVIISSYLSIFRPSFASHLTALASSFVACSVWLIHCLPSSQSMFRSTSTYCPSAVYLDFYCHIQEAVSSLSFIIFLSFIVLSVIHGYRTWSFISSADHLTADNAMAFSPQDRATMSLTSIILVFMLIRGIAYMSATIHFSITDNDTSLYLIALPSMTFVPTLMLSFSMAFGVSCSFASSSLIFTPMVCISYLCTCVSLSSTIIYHTRSILNEHDVAFNENPSTASQSHDRIIYVTHVIFIILSLIIAVVQFQKFRRYRAMASTPNNTFTRAASLDDEFEEQHTASNHSDRTSTHIPNYYSQHHTSDEWDVTYAASASSLSSTSSYILLSLIGVFTLVLMLLSFILQSAELPSKDAIFLLLLTNIASVFLTFHTTTVALNVFATVYAFQKPKVTTFVAAAFVSFMTICLWILDTLVTTTSCIYCLIYCMFELSMVMLYVSLICSHRFRRVE